MSAAAASRPATVAEIFAGYGVGAASAGVGRDGLAVAEEDDDEQDEDGGDDGDDVVNARRVPAGSAGSWRLPGRTRRW